MNIFSETHAFFSVRRREDQVGGKAGEFVGAESVIWQREKTTPTPPLVLMALTESAADRRCC